MARPFRSVTWPQSDPRHMHPPATRPAPKSTRSRPQRSSAAKPRYPHHDLSISGPLVRLQLAAHKMHPARQVKLQAALPPPKARNAGPLPTSRQAQVAIARPTRAPRPTGATSKILLSPRGLEPAPLLH
ncbi:unnamed protein product [Linum trigynum]|uniref:Uncharacterized protein n=1 Tax=Linum trigynum TaxID=586398 RepID=A0AAV2E3E2_9ROSI